MIKIQNLVFEYPGKRALKNVSFDIKAGSITALVGPNGAGKTTLMRCIAALDTPFAGEISVNGIDVLEKPRQVHRQLGYLSDFFGVYKDLNVRQCLLFTAGIYGVPGTELNQKVELAAQRLEIEKYLDVKAGELSRGLRQRLGIAQAIIHEPKLLLLDEPASGLDPEARHNLSNLFIKLQKLGMTLLVSSHILAELEEYCTDMLLLREGQIIDHYGAQQTTKELQQKHTIHIAFSENPKAYRETLAAQEGISEINMNDSVIECSYEGDEKALQGLLKHLVDTKLPIYSFAVQRKTLQDVYMAHASGEKS